MSSLREKLTTLRANTPSGIRRRAVEALYGEIDADFGMYFKCVKHSGRWYYTSPSMRGDPELSSIFTEYIGEPVLGSPWTREHVDAGQIESFIRSHSYFSTDYLYEFEAQSKLMRPLEITDDLRSVFYDGRKFYGWLGLMRRDNDRQFDGREEERAEAAVDRFKAAFLAAESLERDFFRPGPLFVTVKPNGEVERASWRGRRWLTPRRCREIGWLVRRYDGGTDERPVHVFEGSTVHVTRLDGGSYVRYLIQVDHAELPEYDPLVGLTDRQREVAEFAATGATNPEIAETLGVAVSTVKYHLKRIYDDLEIEGRVDLAELV